MSQKLRLNFNERSDFISPIDKRYPFEQSLWQYPIRQPLEKLIAERFKLEPAQILCTNGGDEAIMILMRIIKESSQLILPLPAFSQYIWGIESWKLDTQVIQSNSDLSIDVEGTLTAISSVSGTVPGADVMNPSSVTIITRPNNPTGEMIAIETLTQIIEAAKNNGGWVFLDEAYIEFSDDAADHVEVTQSLLAQFDNLVILRTLSKAYGLAGIRLGYLLGSKSLISEFDKRCAPFNIAQPTLQIAAEALAEDNQADVENFCQKITANRNQLFDWFITNNIPVLPSQANFLVLQLPNQQAAAIESFLAKNGILVRSFASDDLANCLRITIPYKIGLLQELLKQALKPDLICIDMDGVLIDTSGSYDATIVATVKQISDQIVEQSDIDNLKNSGGYNNDWVVSQKLLEDHGFSLKLSEVIDVFQQLYLGENNDGFVSNETSLINRTLIDSIKQSSSTFAIVTGRPLNDANAGKSLIDLSELDLISLDCVEQPKPSPEGIERLQQKHSAMSWMCGDNPDDMQAAVASNSLAIGIRATSKEILYEAGADIVLNNINELEDWLCPLN